MRLGRSLLALDLYGILGVERGAEAAQIRAAYRREIRRSHPDLHPGRERWAGQRTVQLNLAAQVLLDQALRAQYDRARAEPLPARPTTPYECQWHRPERNSAQPGGHAVPLGADLDAVLAELRTGPERLLWHVLTWSGSLTPPQSVAFTLLCVAFFASVLATTRPRPLFDPPERQRAGLDAPRPSSS